MPSEQRLIWVDMEMTGLNPDVDRVIEIATIVTSTDLVVLAQGPVIAIHQHDDVLSGMDDWNTATHGRSGLTDRVRASRVDEREAALATLAFLSAWVEPNTSPMCGNSIGQDRRFMARYMPDLETFFHYRNLDVTTLKLLAAYWRHDLPPLPKKNVHEALADIVESIEELRYYREHLIQGAP